jgi:ppGpp synthetase/RelA/SpoT-type nucleotidyltranferase
MPDQKMTKEHETAIDALVAHYIANQSLIRRFLESVHAQILDATNEGEPLSELVHSVKRRMKAPDGLKDKLIRKLVTCESSGQAFDVTADNLFLRINDLGGYRILHLHTQQMGQIHAILLDLLDKAQCDLYEKPFANIWDEESRAYFEGIGIHTEVNTRLYSSVHYVIQPRSKTLTCEIEVRTLADEIWGEIDHRINYPQAHPSLACREQIKALARVASSCSRLVDSIMASHDDWVARTTGTLR